MRRSAAGFVALEFVVAVGLLLFPVTLVVASLPRWSERQTMARTAAQEAARAWARSSSDVAGSAAALQAAHEVAGDFGVDPARVDVRFEGTLARGAEVAVHVTVPMPAIVFPGTAGLGEWHWTATDRETIDRYRSL